MCFDDIRQMMETMKTNINRVIVGKEEVIEQFMIALIASGHVLLEDVPGTGKTMLAKTLAASLNCRFSRVQFTPDLLPSDLTGIHFFNQQTSTFEFRSGPVFTHVLLADELNRATPRTQSSLLECMEERQVTIDGVTKKLERPFFVIATQNPIESQGTFPLPEAQLDRFMMRIQMGYPTKDESMNMLKRFKEQEPLEQLSSVVSKKELLAAQDLCRTVNVDESVLSYMIAIVEKTRNRAGVSLGVSPRGNLSLLRASQIRAVLQGREFVLPDDVKALAIPVLAHRLLLRQTVGEVGQVAETVIHSILDEVPVPSEDELVR